MTDTPTTYRVFDRETFADEMERIGIPRHMFAGITRYVFDGIGGGDFQTAIFQNDFVRAAGQADDKNQHCLFEYARLLYNHVPIDAWGSRDKVSAWVKGKGLVGRGYAAPTTPTPTRPPVKVPGQPLSETPAPRTVVIENRPYDDKTFNRVRVAILDGQEIATSFGSRKEIEAAVRKMVPGAVFTVKRI